MRLCAILTYLVQQVYTSRVACVIMSERDSTRKPLLCDMLSKKSCCESKRIRLLAAKGRRQSNSLHVLLQENSLQPVCLLLKSGAECFFFFFLQAARLRQPPLQQQLLVGVQLPQQLLQVILYPPAL